jgi:hypothetical protein
MTSPAHHTRLHLLGASLALACVSTFAAPQPGPAVKDFPYAKAGRWEVRFVAADAKGSKFVHCRAERLYGTETFLMLFDSGRDMHVGFSGSGAFVAAKQYATRWWVDRPDPVIQAQAQEVVEPATEVDVMRFRINNSEPGELDMLMAGSRLFVQGPEKKPLAYDMAGSGAAFKSLMACAERFVPPSQRR